MNISSRLKAFVRKVRNYGQKVEESRTDLADSVSSENVLPPIPPDKPRRDRRP
jgi:hypothetical protein